MEQETVKYQVTGMSCAACSARVEKAVAKVPGVTECSVNLLTNTMGVSGSCTSEAVIEAVEKAGYGANVQGNVGKEATATSSDHVKDTPTKQLRTRLIFSLLTLIPLMYLSMGHTMWGWPLPASFADNHVAMGLAQMLLTTLIMVINQRFFISGVRGALYGAPNMDTLVSLGAGASYGYSLWILFAMTGAMQRGDEAAVMGYMHEFYFESAGMILTLITVGKMLEARSKGRTTDALKGLMKLAPKRAVCLREGKEVVVDIAEVRPGDRLAVRPGESFPVDGIVIEGSSAVNESALTGESIPVDKKEGDKVSAATLNESGYLVVEALHVGEDTTLAKIIQMVSDASATKAPIAKLADKVSGIFVPSVIGIAVVTILGWLLAGKTVGWALARGIAVLVISCPCALGLATPVAIMVGNGVAAKHGILFKTAEALEMTGKLQILALDKTGTITKGQPRVTELLPAAEVTEEELLSLAAVLEQKSEHPLAKAVLQEAEQRLQTSAQTEDKDNLTEFRVFAGNGLLGMWKGKELLGGNQSFIETRTELPRQMADAAERLAGEGKTPMFFAWDKKPLGIIAVWDVLKEESPAAIKELKEQGLRVVMLTGDNERTARKIAELAGIEEVYAGVLPDGKEAVIRELKSQGRVAMVGDGINDAPALMRADIGIAIGAGTDIAIDAAEVVLMRSNLLDVPEAVRLSRRTRKNIVENLFWAFFYNVIGIPLAAGVWYPLFGWKLNPMFGAAAMSLSSVCVVGNALRLYKEKTKREEEKVEKMMEKTMLIKGMMCGHCEANVKQALEAVDGVQKAEVSHVTGTAVITLQKDVSDETLKSTVTGKGYEVTEIK